MFLGGSYLSHRGVRRWPKFRCGTTEWFHNRSRSSALVGATRSSRLSAKTMRSTRASTAGFLIPIRLAEPGTSEDCPRALAAQAAMALRPAPAGHRSGDHRAVRAHVVHDLLFGELAGGRRV